MTRIIIWFLGVKLSDEETICDIVRHFYTDFQLILALSRKFSSSGNSETFLSKIPRILWWKTLKTTTWWKFWKAHTFPPSDKNNWQGQKCMLKTVIFKVSWFETFFPKFFAGSKLFPKTFRHNVDFIRTKLQKIAFFGKNFELSHYYSNYISMGICN